MFRIVPIILLPFIWTNSFSQTVVISTMKVFSFYQWVDNPFQAIIENNSCKNVIIKADKGIINVDSNCNYIYKTADNNFFYDTIHVGIKKHSKLNYHRLKADGFV